MYVENIRDKLAGTNPQHSVPIRLVDSTTGKCMVEIPPDTLGIRFQKGKPTFRIEMTYDWLKAMLNLYKKTR